MPDLEIECLERMYSAFSDMPDDRARCRALWWLSERHKSDVTRRRHGDRAFSNHASQRWADDGGPIVARH